MIRETPCPFYSILLENSAAFPAREVLFTPGKAAISNRQLTDHLTGTMLWLNQRGFKQGDRIALALPAGADMLTAFMAVSAVCASAPLNPGYQLDEFLFSLADLRVRAVILPAGASPLARKAAETLGIAVIDLNPDPLLAGIFTLEADLPADLSITTPEPAQLDDLALLLHTSGTTSRPKIVPLSHRNIFHSGQNQEKAMDLSPADLCMNIMPMHNIHGLVTVCLAAIVSGGRLIATPGFVANQIMDWFSNLTPTWYSAVPSLHQAVLDQARLQPEKALGAGLRFIRSSSAPLPASMARQLNEVFAAPVVDALGMTEATGGIAIVRMPPPPGKEGTVGLPQGTSLVRAMDEFGSILPPNAVGELCLSGPNIITAYENNPEANAALFNNGWLRMGDLGSVDEDGYVFIKGRVKEIINRGGAKIAPYEVDEALLRHPAVKQAAAFALPHPILGEDVAAAVVLRDGFTTTMRELRQFTAASLADYKVPRQIIFVTEIPHSSAGKIQRVGMAERFRQALSELAGGAAEKAGPANEIETEILSIWQDILGQRGIGVNDDYLVMGGDSIRAAIILMNINERYNTNLAVGDIFNAPTVASMAALVQAKMGTPLEELRLPPILTRQQNEAPLTAGQASLWLIQQLDPNTVAYNFSFLFRISGGVDPIILEKALNALVLRHESLRTVYPSRGGVPYQYVLPHAFFRLRLEDYSHLPPEERQLAVQRFAEENANVPFFLDREISGRYVLLHTAPAEDYLYMCSHHINWDAWSRYLFTADLMRLYAAIQQDKLDEIVDLPVQYSDYAATQAEWMRNKTRSTFVQHWKNVLAGDLPLLDLPTDHPRPRIHTDHGRRFHYDLPPQLSTRMKTFCRELHITPFHLLVAGYAVLLSRYAGQEDVIFGCPFANRPRPELNGIIGLFSNVLPLRINLAGDVRVRDLLEQARAVVIDALAWQALPFSDLVADLDLQRDLSRIPVFQTTINMLNVPRQSTSAAGLVLSDVRRDDMPAQFDLSFDFADDGDHFSASVIYNTDLYERDTVTRWTEHLQNIIAGMIADTQQPISSLRLFSPAEETEMLVQWNRTNREYPREMSIHRLFEVQAARAPDSLAVEYGARRMTYARLNSNANQLARHLLAAGVRPGSPVGLYMERSPEMVTAMLAIVKTGGAYVPLDPAYPAERLRFMLRDAGVEIVIGGALTSETPHLQAHELEARFISLQADAQEIACHGDTNLADYGAPDDLAYIIYTSGSTGTPKGICIPHRAVNRLVLNPDYISLAPGDRIAQASSMSFDAATFEVWGALLNGGTLVGIPQEILLSPPDLALMLRQERIDSLFLTTALYNHVASTVPTAFSSLRDLIFGGEAVTPQWVSTVLRSGPPRRLVHAYGPTEATTFATCHLVQSVEDTDPTIPIGMPITNTTAYVLDAHLRPVPRGVTGELYLGGDGLALGYLNRPELTAERFVSNPFEQVERAAGLNAVGRLYKTGDLVRRLQSGAIEFIRRGDDQVKLRGFRIELGEIEETLRRHPQVKDAIVLLQPDSIGEKRLAAWVVFAPGESVSGSALREYLKQHLPVYMIPAVFTAIPAIPITPNGKVDRQALSIPDTDQPSTEIARPETVTETRLAAIWQDVLGIPAVGREDHFFEIGGDSLRSIQITVRVRALFNVPLTALRIFETPRLADLATHIDNLLEENSAGGRQEDAEREEFRL